jgi:tetratricopeptide (TPR) repeat protein
VLLYQRAIRLDPNFAMAYASLGSSYFNLGETELASENTRKAYELRERVSDRERFYIESHYYHLVTGDLEKARQVYELWAQTYPRDDVPPNNLGRIYQRLGQYHKDLTNTRETLRLDPGSSQDYANLVSSYLVLNRLEEARATADEALAKKLDSPYLRLFLYQLAFLQNDTSGMAQQAAWAAGKPGVVDVLLHYESETAAYSGRLGQARELSRRAVASAKRAEEKETAAGYEADAAVREALFGKCRRGPAAGHCGARPFDGPGCAGWSGAGAGLDRRRRPRAEHDIRFGQAIPRRYDRPVQLPANYSRAACVDSQQRIGCRGGSSDFI